MRLPRGVIVQGGFSTGHEVIDNCDVVGKVDNAAADRSTSSAAGIGTPQITNINGVGVAEPVRLPRRPPFQTQVKLLGSYPLPWDLAASATFQSVPGPQSRRATRSAVRRSRVARSRPGRRRRPPRRPCSSSSRARCTATALNQLDAGSPRRSGSPGSRRVQAMLDFYNLLNVGPSRAEQHVRAGVADADGHSAGPAVQVRRAAGLLIRGVQGGTGRGGNHDG